MFQSPTGEGRTKLWRHQFDGQRRSPSHGRSSHRSFGRSPLPPHRRPSRLWSFARSLAALSTTIRAASFLRQLLRPLQPSLSPNSTSRSHDAPPPALAALSSQRRSRLRNQPPFRPALSPRSHDDLGLRLPASLRPLLSLLPSQRPYSRSRSLRRSGASRSAAAISSLPLSLLPFQRPSAPSVSARSHVGRRSVLRGASFRPRSHLPYRRSSPPAGTSRSLDARSSALRGWSFPPRQLHLFPCRSRRYAWFSIPDARSSTPPASPGASTCQWLTSRLRSGFRADRWTAVRARFQSVPQVAMSPGRAIRPRSGFRQGVRLD